MNYFLLLVILGMCGGFYYIHLQDEQQIAALQSQVDTTPPARSASPSAASQVNTANPANTSAGGLLPRDAAIPGFSNAPGTQPGHATPAAPAVAILPPDASRSDAIDSAATAASAAQNADSLGTITTLDGHTYQNCRVLKVESDGVTFTDTDGITKILFPLLPPDMQKKFGYDAKAAVAQTAAEINYQQQAQQAGGTTNSAPTGSNP